MTKHNNFTYSNKNYNITPMWVEIRRGENMMRGVFKVSDCWVPPTTRWWKAKNRWGSAIELDFAGNVPNIEWLRNTTATFYFPQNGRTYENLKPYEVWWNWYQVPNRFQGNFDVGSYSY